jgi:POT family proton-dependent oligopeptide transporter
MQNPAHSEGVPGALGLGQSVSSSVYNAFFFFSYLTPLPFAIISDVWLGRYATLRIALV